MFESLDRSFKSKVIVASCCVGIGFFLYRRRPNYFDGCKDWSYFPTCLNASMTTPEPATVATPEPAKEPANVQANVPENEPTKEPEKESIKSPGVNHD